MLSESHVITEYRLTTFSLLQQIKLRKGERRRRRKVMMSSQCRAIMLTVLMQNCRKVR